MWTGKDGCFEYTYAPHTLLACKKFHLCTAECHGSIRGVFVFDMEMISRGCVLCLCSLLPSSVDNRCTIAP